MHALTSGILLTLCLVLTCGCATVVSQQLPANLSPGGNNKGAIGKVAYNHSGLPDIVRLRKERAYEKIVEICGGTKYEVIAQAVEEMDSYASDFALLGTKNAMVIQFRCQ